MRHGGDFLNQIWSLTIYACPPAVLDFTGKTVEELMLEAKEELGADMAHNVYIAFVGVTSSTKSSLINSLRGLGPGDPKACKVDNKECTKVPDMYPYKEDEDLYKRIVFCDMPGCGTKRNPAPSYVRDKKMYFADLIVFCYHAMIPEVAHWMLKDLMVMGRQTVFVHTMVHPEPPN